jgi:hypothetical protein
MMRDLELSSPGFYKGMEWVWKEIMQASFAVGAMF